MINIQNKASTDTRNTVLTFDHTLTYRKQRLLIQCNTHAFLTKAFHEIHTHSIFLTLTLTLTQTLNPNPNLNHNPNPKHNPNPNPKCNPNPKLNLNTKPILIPKPNPNNNPKLHPNPNTNNRNSYTFKSG